MNWLEIVQDLVLMVIQILIIPLIAFGLNALKEYLENKIKLEKGQDIIARAYDAVSTSVGYVAQTFVDDVKGTPEWDTDKMQAAAFKALVTAKTLLGKDALAILADIVGNVDDWLKTAIEDEVSVRKLRE